MFSFLIKIHSWELLNRDFDSCFLASSLDISCPFALFLLVSDSGRSVYMIYFKDIFFILLLAVFVHGGSREEIVGEVAYSWVILSPVVLQTE